MQVFTMTAQGFFPVLAMKVEMIKLYTVIHFFSVKPSGSAVKLDAVLFIC